MSLVRCMLVVAALALAVPGRAASGADDQQPEVMPTRDVDITYQITRQDQPPNKSRRRWLASEHLQRVDGSGKSATIFDRSKGEFTLINPTNRTYRKFEGSPRSAMSPQKGTALTRGGESVVAGLSCVDWSWTVDAEKHTACLTPDGVMLRIVVDGKTVMQALSVRYRPQPAELFQVPRGYEPALAPEGEVGD
jgi:hypothetical protein